MKRKTVESIFLICLFTMLASCQNSQTPSPSGYPDPAVDPTSLDSPLNMDDGAVTSPLSAVESPLSEPTNLEIRPFHLDKPIKAGASQITGTGPAGVPIVLLDITFGGTLLAQGSIDETGEFRLQTFQPLETSHRIGITLGNLTGTKWRPEDFADDGFHGDDAVSVPQVGFFFDSWMIHE